MWVVVVPLVTCIGSYLRNDEYHTIVMLLAVSDKEMGSMVVEKIREIEELKATTCTEVVP